MGAHSQLDRTIAGVLLQPTRARTRRAARDGVRPPFDGGDGGAHAAYHLAEHAAAGGAAHSPRVLCAPRGLVTATRPRSQLFQRCCKAHQQGEWQAKAVSDIGEPAKIPLPVDISITSDDAGLWVDTFMDGKKRLFDISDPFNPKQVYEREIGKQINMISQSWDGKRAYFTSSLLANWDKKGDDNEQYFKAFEWNGKELVLSFSIDFNAETISSTNV